MEFHKNQYQKAVNLNLQADQHRKKWALALSRLLHKDLHNHGFGSGWRNLVKAIISDMGDLQYRDSWFIVLKLDLRISNGVGKPHTYRRNYINYNYSYFRRLKVKFKTNISSSRSICHVSCKTKTPHWNLVVKMLPEIR